MDKRLTIGQLERVKDILAFIDQAGISLTKVATATGLNRPTLNNKISWLQALYNSRTAASRSRFLIYDLIKLEDYLIQLRAELDYTISRKPRE